MTNPDVWTLPGSGSSASLEIVLPVLPVEECRSSGLGRQRTARRAAEIPCHDDRNRYRVVVHRFFDDIVSAVDGHLHANPIFFRTLSNPVSWNVASWPTPWLSSTLVFSRAPSGSDRRSSTASSLYRAVFPSADTVHCSLTKGWSLI